jgi:hypothetical protein
VDGGSEHWRLEAGGGQVNRWKVHHDRCEGRIAWWLSADMGMGTISVCDLSKASKLGPSLPFSHTPPAKQLHSFGLVLKLSFPRKQRSHSRSPLREKTRGWM